MLSATAGTLSCPPVILSTSTVTHLQTSDATKSTPTSLTTLPTFCNTEMSVYLLWGAFCYFLWRAMIEWQQNWDQYCASYSSFNITHFNLIYVQQQLGTNHMTQIPFIFFIGPFFHYTNNTIETNIIHMAGGQTRIQTFNILWKLLQFTNLQLHFLKVWQTKRHFTFWARMRNCEKRLLATSCVCLSVRPSARMELGSHWTDLHEIWYVRVFRKCGEKGAFHENDKNNGHFTWRPT